MGEVPITQLLADAQGGSPEAANALFPLVYDALRELARLQMNGGNDLHTLQPTALVHEAYLKLLGRNLSYTSKEHFLRAAAKAMRHILLDYAKARTAAKRGGARRKVALEDCHLAISTPQEDILTIDEAISRLGPAHE
jgi:RNA polymerase sigma factor (TIGR02999 family)